MPGGLVARANKVTMPEELPVATPFDKLRINRAVRRGAGPFWPIAASFVKIPKFTRIIVTHLRHSGEVVANLRAQFHRYDR
jgi:hypothetical protein